MANNKQENSIEKSEYVGLTLLDTPLIDTKNADWDQIVEMRADSDAHKKLINLRFFFHDNYQGKPITYIEDDINKRLDAYKHTSKKHGFDLITSSLSTLLDAKQI